MGGRIWGAAAASACATLHGRVHASRNGSPLLEPGPRNPCARARTLLFLPAQVPACGRPDPQAQPPAHQCLHPVHPRHQPSHAQGHEHQVLTPHAPGTEPGRAGRGPTLLPEACVCQSPHRTGTPFSRSKNPRCAGAHARRSLFAVVARRDVASRPHVGVPRPSFARDRRALSVTPPRPARPGLGTAGVCGVETGACLHCCQGKQARRAGV